VRSPIRGAHAVQPTTTVPGLLPPSIACPSRCSMQHQTPTPPFNKWPPDRTPPPFLSIEPAAATPLKHTGRHRPLPRFPAPHFPLSSHPRDTFRPPLLHLVQCRRRRIAAAPNFGHEHCRRLPHSVSHSPCASWPRFLMRTSPPPSPLAAGANLHRRLPPELSTPSKTSPPRPLLLPHRGLPLLVSFRRLDHAWQVPRPTLVLVVTAVRCASARAASIGHIGCFGHWAGPAPGSLGPNTRPGLLILYSFKNLISDLNSKNFD
jgi:hypothetical protein